MRRAMLTAAAAAMVMLAPAMASAADEGDAHRGQPAPLAPDFELPAVQLRIQLGRALGEHAFLSIEAMRTGIAGGEEFEVAAELLEGNTVEVVEMVRLVYGDGAADAFAELWRNHIGYLVDFTRAIAEGDSDAREIAASQLQAYADDFSAFLVEANPCLPRDAVTGLIQEHVQQLEQIASLADEGFSDAYPAIRGTYAHMFMVGDGLGLGILTRFGDRFPGRDTAFSPALDLRLTLDRLLGEHAYLAAIAMRARLTATDELDAAVAALDDNSGELAAQVAKIYGADAGAAFDSLWRSHADLYLAYVDAVAENDVDAEEAALEGLRTYRSDFSSFLGDANPYLDAGDLEALLATHTEHLVAQVEAYEAEDFEAAYGTLREAYAHTESIAAGLAGAIADQFPQQFPDTALGDVVPSAPPVGAAGWLLLLAGSAATLLGRRGRGAGGARGCRRPRAVPATDRT